MDPNKKTEVLNKLKMLLEDLEMLRDGTWIPDQDSCECKY